MCSLIHAPILEHSTLTFSLSFSLSFSASGQVRTMNRAREYESSGIPIAERSVAGHPAQEKENFHTRRCELPLRVIRSGRGNCWTTKLASTHWRIQLVDNWRERERFAWRSYIHKRLALLNGDANDKKYERKQYYRRIDRVNMHRATHLAV